MPGQKVPNDTGVPESCDVNFPGQQSLSELKSVVWSEVLDLFEGNEKEAREWMSRNRPFLGNMAPEYMLDSQENIHRLRCFIQQIQRGVLP
ncbi:MAG: Uncharacterized protein AWU57_2773 [Marinobacter sp. T13-3]|jgi:uncharacterized protein (DUF2384 family)|nr:MAG: Uncharacterized protein AWU57_2773 [Marinobacter sp. T13-3]